MRTVVRRVVASRVRDPHLVDDLVQETLARVLAAWGRIDEQTAVPYAITTARHLVASTWRRVDVDARNRHRAVDLAPVDRPDDAVVDQEEDRAVAAAMGNLSQRDRDALVEHDVEGRDLASLAQEMGTTPGALAAQLKRTRARLRVEYLLAMDRTEPPTPTCRPVLLALSGGDRRRQAELDVSGHLLACGFCAGLATGLGGGRSGDEATTVVPVTRDADVVTARKAGREMALELGFSTTDGTVRRDRHLRGHPQHRQVRGDRRGADQPGRGRAAGRSAGGGARRRARHPGPRAGHDRRAQHVRRAGAGPARVPTADGRVRAGVRDGEGHDGDHAQVERHRQERPTTRSSTMVSSGRTGTTDAERAGAPIGDLEDSGWSTTRACCPSWSRTCASTAPSCARSGRAGSRSRTCSRP